MRVFRLEYRLRWRRKRENMMLRFCLYSGRCAWRPVPTLVEWGCLHWHACVPPWIGQYDAPISLFSSSSQTIADDALTRFLGSFFAVISLAWRLLGSDLSPFDFRMPAHWCPLGESNARKVGPKPAVSGLLGSRAWADFCPNTTKLVHTSNCQSLGVKCGRWTCCCNVRTDQSWLVWYHWANTCISA